MVQRRVVVRQIESMKKEFSLPRDTGLRQLASRDAQCCARCDGRMSHGRRRSARHMVVRKHRQANNSANIEVRGRVQTEAH